MIEPTPPESRCIRLEVCDVGPSDPLVTHELKRATLRESGLEGIWTDEDYFLTSYTDYAHLFLSPV